MSNINLKISLKISFYNEVFIGGGKGSGLIDSFVVKDSNKKPYIPASTVKGRIRYNTSLLLNSFNNIGQFCGFENDNTNNCTCDICKLFGGKGNNRGYLYFDDLKLDKNSEDYLNDYSVRTGILVSRYTKQVKDQALFKYETTGLGGEHIFKGDIEGYIPSEDYKRYAVILYTAISMIQTIGGNQSRGLGWIGKNSEVKIFIDEEEINKNILKEWGKLIEI